MKEKINFKKILATLAILTIVVPGSLNVVACKDKETKQESENVNTLIINEINNNLYTIEVKVNSKINDLKTKINADFIKEKITNNKSAFQNKLFTLNKITNDKDIKLTDDDLKTNQVINAKINYNYSSIKDQSTKLIIIFKDELMQLTEVFKNFKFKDQRNVANFLDANDLKTITNQIKNHIKEYLEPAGLILENQQATSIILKAKSDSKKYQGAVKLTWNLKLVEIWGTEFDKANDLDVRQGLKIYFYLSHQDNQIKAFDVAGYKDAKGVPIIKTDINYNSHYFHFVNNKNVKKEYAIAFYNLTSEIPNLFDKFDFTNGVQVKMSSDPLEYTRLFNKDKGQWVELWKESDDNYLIDHLGNIN